MLRLSFSLIVLLSFAANACAQAKLQKILFVGNSITLHGPKADIYWHVKNVADFERNHLGYDIAGKFTDAAAFKADLIILCIGENVAALKTPADQAKYQEQVTALLKTLKSAPNAQVIVRSSFWANTAKDTAMRNACEAVSGTFVDISALGKDEQNYGRSERPYKHAGVANHPGDRGMAAIAEAIVKVVK